MNEDLHVVNLFISGENFEATPLNTHLYTFLGKTALENGDFIENSSRNHVFIRRPTEDGEIYGTYLFDQDFVRQMGSIMLQNGYHCDINRRSIPEHDEQAYQKYLSQQESADDIDDFIPDDWS